jgi:TPR repeat protein
MFGSDMKEDANTAIKLEPNNGFAYNNRGYASQKKNDTRKAMLDYEVGCSFKIELACKNFRLLKESLQKPAQ